MAAKQRVTVRKVRTRTRTWRSSSTPKKSSRGKRRCPTCGKYM